MDGRRKLFLVAPLLVVIGSAAPVSWGQTPGSGVPADGSRDGVTGRPLAAGETRRDPFRNSDRLADAPAPATNPPAPTAADAPPPPPAEAADHPAPEPAPRRSSTPAVRQPGSFYPAGSGFSAGGNGAGYGPSDYPAAQFNTYAMALARATTARALFRRADSELNLSVRAFERRFDTSPELQQALTAERNAYNELNATRRRALQAVTGEEKYQRLLALRSDLSEQIQQGRSDRSLTIERVMAMAQVKMKYGTDLHAMEADVLNADAAVRDAQNKLVAAGSQVAALRQKHDDARRNDPDLLTARRNLDDARITRVTAEAYLAGTITSADVALDAYYWARTPYRGYWPNSYANGYGPYSFGY